MATFKIKKITLADISQLQKIGKQTFQETFSESTSEENMKIIWKKDFLSKN